MLSESGDHTAWKLSVTLELAVGVVPLCLRRDCLRRIPMLHDSPVLEPKKVIKRSVNSAQRPFTDRENKVSISEEDDGSGHTE